jgi:predicted transcriptional regulator
MKTEVYSWRLSGDLKSDLEREARARKVPVSSVLEKAVRDWLKNSAEDSAGDETQHRLHSAAAGCLGVLAGHNPHRAETARAAVRKRLRRRNVR